MPPFDPYWQWLGVPPWEQPADHYRLLGVARFESDPRAIQAAADARMALVRTHQLGPNAMATQKLLNEIAQAKLCLLHPERRAAYDLVLRHAAPPETDRAPAFRGVPRRAAPPAASASERARKATSQAPAFGPYQVVEDVGVSSVGIFYTVQHRDTGRYYALKTLPAESVKNEAVVKRFRREIDIVTRLDHENLIAGVEGGEANGIPYLVTEYVLGADLATLVKRQGARPVDEAVEHLVQAAGGLKQLHAHGVIHRNLKPHVLLVDTQGRLKITNLLLAKIGEDSPLEAGEQLTAQGELLGTIDYLAPEQATGAAAVDGRADIYALGCVLHFLLTGRPPYSGKTMGERLTAHFRAPIPSLRSERQDVPPELDRIFQRMLAKRPQGRYPSVADLLNDLEQFQGHGATAARATGRWLWWLAACAVAGVVLGVVAALLLNG